MKGKNTAGNEKERADCGQEGSVSYCDGFTSLPHGFERMDASQRRRTRERLMGDR